ARRQIAPRASSGADKLLLELRHSVWKVTSLRRHQDLLTGDTVPSKGFPQGGSNHFLRSSRAVVARGIDDVDARRQHSMNRLDIPGKCLVTAVELVGIRAEADRRDDELSVGMPEMPRGGFGHTLGIRRGMLRRSSPDHTASSASSDSMACITSSTVIE